MNDFKIKCLNCLSIFSLLLGLASCASAKKQPLQATPDVRAELSKIEIDISSGATKRAIQRLEKITINYANTDAADDAFIWLGQIYYKQNDFNNSYRSFMAVINSEFFSPREVDAALGAAKALFKLGRFDEALTLTHQAVKNSQSSDRILLEIYTLRYNIQVQIGDRLDALRSLVFLAEKTPDTKLQSRYRIKAFEYVDSSLKDVELIQVANEPSFSFVRASALYRVGITFFDQRDYSRAENAFQDLIKTFPSIDLSSSAKQYLAQIEARRRVAPFTVGAILPLSGRHATIGQKTLRGLQMGLGIYGTNPTEFKLAVIDSEANPDVARRAVERLVVEDSAIAIVGDLLSKTAEPIAHKADELGVPVIGLSQKSGLTEIGPNIFRNALTSQAIVKELVANSMNKYGHKNFAIIYPNDPYGIEYANIFWDEVLSRGGQVTAAQSYSKSEKDFNGPVSRLVGTFYLDSRADEYHHLVTDWYSKQKTINSRVTPPTDLLPPIVGFDAVFIPDDVKALGQIASMLLYNDISGVRLIGTNLWNTSSLVSRGTSLINNALFIDAKSSVDSSFQKSAFARDYKKLYNEEATVFEAQAYDTGLALRELISGGARSRPALRDSLTRLKRFSGAIGEIEITDSREFTRPLTLLTVIDGQITQAKEPVKTNSY